MPDKPRNSLLSADGTELGIDCRAGEVGGVIKDPVEDEEIGESNAGISSVVISKFGLSYI